MQDKPTKEDWERIRKDHPSVPTQDDWGKFNTSVMKKFDNINPKHYKSNGIEAIDVMVNIFGRGAVTKWAEINAFKYIFRMHNKGARVDNIKKAIWNLEFALGKDPRDRGDDA